MNVWRRSEGGWVSRLQDGLFVGLTLGAWLFGSLLVAVGAATTAVFLLSGAALHSFLLHLHNLTIRYVAADSLRQASFAELLAFGMAGLLVVVCLMRLPVLCRRLGTGLEPCTGDEE